MQQIVDISDIEQCTFESSDNQIVYIHKCPPKLAKLNTFIQLNFNTADKTIFFWATGALHHHSRGTDYSGSFSFYEDGDDEQFTGARLEIDNDIFHFSDKAFDVFFSLTFEAWQNAVQKKFPEISKNLWWEKLCLIFSEIKKRPQQKNYPSNYDYSDLVSDYILSYRISLNNPIEPSEQAAGLVLGTFDHKLLTANEWTITKLPDPTLKRYDSDSVSLWVKDDPKYTHFLTQISVHHNYQGTFQGIRIGSPKNELEEKYGTLIQDNEDNMVLKNTPGISFEIDPDSNSSVITEIFVYKDS